MSDLLLLAALMAGRNCDVARHCSAAGSHLILSTSVSCKLPLRFSIPLAWLCVSVALFIAVDPRCARPHCQARCPGELSTAFEILNDEDNKHYDCLFSTITSKSLLLLTSACSFFPVSFLLYKVIAHTDVARLRRVRLAVCRTLARL